MKEIKLANGKGIAFVDDDDFQRVNLLKWNMQRCKNTNYAQHGYKAGKKIKAISMHRFILNAQKGKEVDHRDGNGLNNQKNNIRLCNRSQNNANRKKILAKSGLRGVNLDKHRYKR